MKKALNFYLFLIILSLVLTASCTLAHIQSYRYVNITGYGEEPDAPYTESLTKTYYLDADRGDDTTGTGTASSPWKSLAKMKEVMKPGDTFYLASGSYGPFIEANPEKRTGWINIKAAPGVTATLDYISLRNAEMTNAYLRFDGIHILAPAGTDSLLDILNVAYLNLLNSHIQGVNKYQIATGIKLDTTKKVLIYHNEINTIGRGILFVDSVDGTVSNNFLHELAGRTGLQYERGNFNYIIEKNNIHDSNYDPNDPLSPVDPHASAISIRSGDVIIRQNIFHDIGSSSGIMMYNEEDVPVYNNILIANNLLYDIQNVNIFRLFSMGENIYYINNTVMGHLRSTETAVYRLESAMKVEEIADGYDGTGLHIYNNILGGLVALPPDADLSHNIIWSYFTNDKLFDFKLSVATDPTTKVICDLDTPSPPLDYFRSGFFMETAHTDTMFDPRHGNIINYRLAPTSEALNFGSSRYQLEESLGSLGADGFIRDDGVIRDGRHHSAGCYEYGTGNDDL